MRFGTLLASVLLVKLTCIAEVHSTVSITANPAEGNVVQCNSNVTLTCSTPSNTNTMTWYRNSVQIAFCSAGYCFDDNTLPNYYATFDKAAGKFDVAIRPANNNDSNVQFQCDDGNNSTRFILIVTGDYSTDVSWSQLPSNKTKLECVTGCVKSSTDVRFSWSMENANNTKDVKPLTTELEFSNETVCLIDKNCGGAGRKKYISSVTVTEDNNQTNSYYIVVRVIFVGNPEYNTVLNISDRPFRVKDASYITEMSTHSSSVKHYNISTPRIMIPDKENLSVAIPAGAAGAVVAVLLIIIVSVFIYLRHKKKTKKENENLKTSSGTSVYTLKVKGKETDFDNV